MRVGVVVIAITLALTACSFATSFDGFVGNASVADASVLDPTTQQGDAAARADASEEASVAPPPCTKLLLGKNCQQESECCSNNCQLGRCEGNLLGDGCTEDRHCASNNCHANTCEGTLLGDGCRDDSKCSSNNCFAGRCEGNLQGDGCIDNSKCASGSCYMNRCQ